jgi:hypothetical protein
MPSIPQKFSAADLTPGQNYRVVKPFQDYDGILHPMGESWGFAAKHFLPYEDGLTLLVVMGGQETSIRLQWRGEVIDHFYNFVEAF